LGAFFCSAKKPGFPLQVLGFAYANPVGFPLQSLARLQIRISTAKPKTGKSEEAKKGRKKSENKNFFDFVVIFFELYHRIFIKYGV
jgi:hypothetical protein